MRRGNAVRARWLVPAMTACLALLLPAAASAAKPPPEKYKVLVVTSSAGGLRDAGVAAIKAAGKTAGFSVVAPSPADVGDQFTSKKLETYRAVVFLNTGAASPLTDAQRNSFQNYFQLGGGFVGIGSAVETDASWQFLTSILGTRASGRTDDPVRDGQGRRPRPRGDEGSARVLEPHRRLLQLLDERPRRLARARHGRRGPVRRAAPGQHARRHRRRHDGLPTTRSPGARTTRAAARSTPALGNTSASFDASLTTHLKGAISWTAGQSRPGLQRLRRDRAGELPAGQGQRAAEPQRADRLRPAARRARDPDRPARRRAPARSRERHLGDHRQHPGLHRQRGRPLRPGYRQQLRHEPLGLPVLRPADGRQRQAVGRHAPVTHDDARRTAGAEPRPRTSARGTPTSATSSCRGSSSSTTLRASRRTWTSSSEQQILRVSNNRGACCHVAGDIDFDKHNNLWLVTGDDSAAGGGDSGGFAPEQRQKTDETQTVRVNNATGGTFTLTFNGQTTAPLAVQRDGRADRSRRCRRSATSAPATSRRPAARSTPRTSRSRSSGTLRRSRTSSQLTADASGLTGTTPTAAVDARTQRGRLVAARRTSTRAARR